MWAGGRRPYRPGMTMFSGSADVRLARSADRGRGSVMIAQRRPAAALIATGTACGIAWAAALRGWMIQMAGPGQSQFSWYGTFGLLIAPGAVVGAAFGYAEYRRR